MVHLCGESKKKAAQRGGIAVAVCIFKNLDRKDLLTCNNKRHQDQMKIFSIWANVSIPDEGRERVRREGVEIYIYIYTPPVPGTELLKSLQFPK